MNNLLFNDSVFDKFPVLETKRLTLRKITPEDCKSIFDIYSSVEVLKYFGRHPYSSMTEAEEMINRVINAFDNKEGIRWGITLKNSDELIGSGGFWKLLKDH